MEQYYFIQQNGIKKGPFKLNELKEEKIFFEELVWRSDNDTWKKAIEFEELENIFIKKPPLTPIEEEKKQLKRNFIKKIIPKVVGIYFIIFLLLSFFSFYIANASWEEEKNKYITNKDNVGKNSDDILNEKRKIGNGMADYHGKILKKLNAEMKELKKKYNEKNSKVELKVLDKRFYDIVDSQQTVTHDSLICAAQLYINNEYYLYHNESEIKPKYKIPENVISMENLNAQQQPFLLRPFYAFFSKIYLTNEEQNSSRLFLKNLSLSAFILLAILLIINLSIIYFLIYISANQHKIL